MDVSLRFWRIFRRRSARSTASGVAESSVIAGVSPPSWVDLEDRRASRFSLAAEIAAWSVVAGIVLEDWDDFIKLLTQFSWTVARVAIGGFIVAVGIALEIIFSARSSNAEHKIRDWYAVRVAELNTETERLRKEAVEAQLALKREIAAVELRTGPRRINDRFAAALKDRPKGTVEIWCLPLEREIFLFAAQISQALDAAGWRVLQPKAVPPPDERHGVTLPLTRSLLNPEFILIARSAPLSTHNTLSDTAGAALGEALTRGIIVGGPFAFFIVSEPALPEDFFIIVIGEK